MTMAVRIIAFPEDAIVFFLTQLRGVQPMRGGKPVAATKFDVERIIFHAILAF